MYDFRLYVAVDQVGIVAFDVDGRGNVGFSLGVKAVHGDDMLGMGIIKGKRSCLSKMRDGCPCLVSCVPCSWSQSDVGRCLGKRARAFSISAYSS